MVWLFKKKPEPKIHFKDIYDNEVNIYSYIYTLIGFAIEKEKNVIIISEEQQPYLFDDLFYNMVDEHGTRTNKFNEVVTYFRNETDMRKVYFEYQPRSYFVNMEKITQTINPAKLKITWDK